ncbi:hypothetical protein QE441_001610 [Chryseobacterium sp. SORGH_AS909]|nr:MULTISPECIES: DUF4296 domain-containing protein [unclassified Chryseobacterium]MDQ1102379.1 hypothetical protein [Chryseobacterium sp. SORGH_AS_1048]MDR6085816.1 hypothetical protein [Chryseobacterium sp. SORGH_AS_0909]MDR6130179.1 hypothetical protein [Chryseobacterium sp. SORGH_AS_1175]MDT3407692.1 hypothetical protein [Pseudacidovorax intermedius]
MKNLVFFILFMSMLACNGYIDKPKNLIPKDKMAEILADMAINDQATFVYPNSNLEAGTRFVLKAHQVKPADFVESFKYYTIKQKMKGIADDAQKILLEKDPKAEKYIQDKLKQNGNVPAFAR